MKKTSLLGLAAALLTAGCSTVGVRSGTEEPAHTVVERIGEVEIRRYGPRIAAQTVVTGSSEAARNRGFQRLAGYIFGDNTSRSSIAMTAPVAQAPEPGGPAGSRSIAMTAPVAQGPAGSGRWVIQFFMPGAWTMETLPIPRDPAVSLVELPPESYAVLRFSGLAGTQAVAARQAELAAAVQASTWTADGEPVVWFYDPPWTVPPLRRNEVAVRVTSTAR
jgi:hypothetical protein